jgi:hypothetical protein
VTRQPSGIRHAELWIDPDNVQSQRVAEKLGARLRGWAATGRRSVVHGLTSDEWRGGPGTPDVLAVIPALEVGDLAAASAPVDQPWGAREAVLQDPDGNTVWLSGLPRGETAMSEQRSS